LRHRERHIHMLWPSQKLPHHKHRLDEAL
jgi:hypothetical protein